MVYDVIITGGGVAGLTAAAFLCKSGHKVLVCEKEKKVGGLVNSFEYKGFTFDGGIRAIEDSGIISPMLRRLGIGMDFVENNVSIGIEKEIVRLSSVESLAEYQNLLNSQFPQSTDDVSSIILEIKKVMKYMDILYGIDNPVFLDLKKDRKYIFKKILPWLFKYIFTFKKIQKLDVPIDEYLKSLTTDKVLIDMIAQHFFQKTPAFFALSYFSLYLDYRYPKGGTGALTGNLEKFILMNNGEINTETEICHIDPAARRLTDRKGSKYEYKKLIWAADLKKLYEILDIDLISDVKTRQKIEKMKSDISDKTGGDSVFTLYVTVDLDKSFFADICSEHFFYTPQKKGLMNADINEIKARSGDRLDYISDRQTISEWIKKFYNLTTFEISIPVLRDGNLAPQGKTGLIISTLFEYSLVRHIESMGWYEEFKNSSSEAIINILDAAIFPGMKDKVIDSFSSTPLTIEKITGNSDGAITGWSFTNSFIPAIHDLPKIAYSIKTPIPDVLQAGQWTYSPSGLPISILTGKLAADRV